MQDFGSISCKMVGPFQLTISYSSLAGAGAGAGAALAGAGAALAGAGL